MNLTIFRDSAISSLRERLLKIYRRKTPPNPTKFGEIVLRMHDLLLHESPEYRPPDRRNRPGGILHLKQGITTLIVPDLHARIDFFLGVLLYKDRQGRSNLEKLDVGELQIVCVGDGVHAEGRAAKRWRIALDEFDKDFRIRTAMDQEMRESFGLMEMVMEAKLAFPANFHFLKGNHENINNETGNGNFSFGKFAMEGAMVADYTRKFYGVKFMEYYAAFERNLPLFAIGDKFLISHSEPYSVYDENEILNYRDNPAVIQGLTWTDNDMALEGSVIRMLEIYLDQKKYGHGHYFAGHRAILGRYRYKPDTGFVQIHNPDLSILAIIRPNEVIDVDIDVRETKVAIPE